MKCLFFLYFQLSALYWTLVLLHETLKFVIFQIKRATGDILQNLTNYNISDYLVKTYSPILKKRYLINSI